MLHTVSFHLTANNIPKQEKNMFKLNFYLIKFLSYLYTAVIWLNLITSKAFRSSRSQMFYKIGVLEDFAKFTGKQLCWNHLNKIAHLLSYDLCEIFKNAYFLITPQNRK